MDRIHGDMILYVGVSFLQDIPRSCGMERKDLGLSSAH